APRDHALVLAGHDPHRREVGRLLAGAAHAVEGGAADVQRETRDERRVAGDVEPLLAHLVDAAHDHVLDLARVDLDALDRGRERSRKPKRKLCLDPGEASSRRSSTCLWAIDVAPLANGHSSTM